MIGYWSTFTKTCIPNSANLANWPQYSPSTDEILSLKAGGAKVKTNFRDQHQCNFWDAQEGRAKRMM